MINVFNNGLFKDNKNVFLIAEQISSRLLLTEITVLIRYVAHIFFEFSIFSMRNRIYLKLGQVHGPQMNGDGRNNSKWTSFLSLKLLEQSLNSAHN